MIQKSKLDEILALRKTLHTTPELSMRETNTAKILKTFLKTHTSCTIIDHGAWFYACRHVADDLPTVAFRADMDAIPKSDTGAPFHGCGHDGHCAAVAGLAYLTEDVALSRNLIFLFQPAEETGEGARLCRALFDERKIDVIYGCHTVPGYPAGEILLRKDVFACASRGMILSFSGKQCHAAYPETGNNPARAVARTVEALRDCPTHSYHGTVLATVVGLQVGAKAFGVSAGEGELYLTVRAHYEDDLEVLVSMIEQNARDFCADDGIRLSVSFVDIFPDTVCDAQTVYALEETLRRHDIPVRYLSEPMRWSEDFGWYCKETRGVFFGIGAGEDAPALHTDGFCYNDDLLARTEEVFLLLCRT